MGIVVVKLGVPWYPNVEQDYIFLLGIVFSIQSIRLLGLTKKTLTWCRCSYSSIYSALKLLYYIGVLLGISRDNGKENGNYYSIIGYCWGLYREQWKRKWKLLFYIGATLDA